MTRPVRIQPGPGQESVWDYPRPPRIEPGKRLVTVWFAGVQVARSKSALRVLETAGAPTYYIPQADIRMDLLRAAGGSQSWCEWKGAASYLDVVVDGAVARRAVWSYPNPAPEYRQLTDHYAFYPSLMEGCYLDSELVRPQPGGFYGGWLTADIVGPIKRAPGTLDW